MSPLGQRIAPILLLLFLSPFLTEVFTGSSPVYAFFMPVTFILFTTAGYGFPVLILRELYIRKKLSLLALFILGLAYGLWNEGLFAQTIFYPLHSPIDSFGAYGVYGDIRIPFMLAISSWHALFAVVFPVLFVNYLFKEQASKSWISKKLAWALGGLSFAFGTLGFFINTHQAEFGDTTRELTGNPSHYVFLVIAAIVLTIIALKLPRSMDTGKVLLISAKKLLLQGMGLYLAVFFLPSLLASAGLPAPLFIGYFVLVFIAGAYRYYRTPSLTPEGTVLVALGGEIGVALLGIFVAAITGQFMQAGFVVLCLLFCFWAAYRVSHRLPKEKMPIPLPREDRDTSRIQPSQVDS